MGDKYNGFTNYETWVVKLWLDNDEGTYNYWRERTREASDAYELAEILKEEHQEAAPEMGASAYCDLLNAALQAVNWLEIAEMLKDEHGQ